MRLRHTAAQTDSESWARAIAFATSATDVDEALTGLLTEAGVLTGAFAGGIADLQSRGCRTVWGCGAERLESLLVEEGVVWSRLPFQQDWSNESLLLLADDLADAELDEEKPTLLISLRLHDVPLGCMILLFTDDAPPDATQRENAQALGGLISLVLENHRLFEEARSARQARDHFLTAIHHELRTPATALMLEAGLLQSGLLGTLPPRVLKSIDQLDARVTELVRVVGSVLDLAHLEAGIPPSRGDMVDPKQTIVDILRRVEPTANRKGITLSLFLPRTLPVLQTDGQRFSRILLHLVGNAVKYTDQGAIQVRVERATRALGGTKREPVLTIRVTDSGRGIPPEELERIFEPFAQVEEGARTDSLNRGLGLGLPLARKLARSLGGDVQVESAPGKGTIATFSVPYRQAPGG